MNGHFGHIGYIKTRVSILGVKSELFITNNYYIIWDGSNNTFNTSVQL